MKKAILFLLALAFAISVSNAQSSLKVGKNKHIIELDTSTVTDVRLDTVESFNIDYDISSKEHVQYYSFFISYDVSANNDADTSITILLQKSYDGSTYTDLDTVSYRMTADTSFVFEEISSGLAANHLRLKSTMNSHVGDTCDLAGVVLKLYNR